MGQSVTLKGVKSGLVMKVDENLGFDELREQIREKFTESASFFGGAHMVLSIQGMVPDEQQMNEILDIIKTCSQLKIDAVLLEDEELQKKFSEMLGDDPGSENEIKELQKDNAALAKTVTELKAALGPGTAQIHLGNLRSGSSIEAQGSIIIMGDVKPGATVTAGGSIFVLGALQGTADAGAYGDTKAFVMAHTMDPLQIVISDVMAISQDKIMKKKRGFLKSKNEVTPEAALISGGHIVIVDYDSDFIRNCRFFDEKDKDKDNGGNING